MNNDKQEFINKLDFMIVSSIMSDTEFNSERVWDLVLKLKKQWQEEARAESYNDGYIDGIKNREYRGRQVMKGKKIHNILEIIRHSYRLGSGGRENDTDKQIIEDYYQRLKSADEQDERN